MREGGGVPEWFAKEMVALAEAYPSFRLREGTIRIYFAYLKHLTPPQVRDAVVRAPGEYPHFFPAAGELLGLAEPLPSEGGLIAWSGFMQAAADAGAYESILCEDGAAAAALVQVFGSWPDYCEQAPDGLSSTWISKRAEFLAAYRAASRGDRRPARLVGLCGDATPTPGVWAARLTRAGKVVLEKAVDQIAAPTLAPKQIGEGDDGAA